MALMEDYYLVLLVPFCYFHVVQGLNKYSLLRCFPKVLVLPRQGKFAPRHRSLHDGEYYDHIQIPGSIYAGTLVLSS